MRVSWARRRSSSCSLCARRRARVPGTTWPGVRKSQLRSQERVGDLSKLCRSRGLPREVHATSQAKAAPHRGKVTGRGRQQRGVRPHVRELQVPGGGACTLVYARVCACVHADSRGRRHRPGGREAGARAEGAAAHTALTPAPTRPPPPRTPRTRRASYLSPLSTPFSSCCWGTCCRGGGWL